MPDAFEQWLSSLVETGAVVPPEDETPAERARFREWAADIWLSWKRFDIMNPHAAEVDIARAEIDRDWAELDEGGEV